MNIHYFLQRIAGLYLDLTLYSRPYMRTIERSLLDLFGMTAGRYHGFKPALIVLTGWPPTSPRSFVYSDFIGWGFLSHMNTIGACLLWHPFHVIL
jgi:hypothetical protein